jgi:hypothetical protein
MSARKRLCTRRDARAHGAIVSGDRPAFEADIRWMTPRAGQGPAGVFDQETARGAVRAARACAGRSRRGEVRDGSVLPPRRR